MRVGIPTWCGRISPVFDVARCLILVDVERGSEIHREGVTIEATEPTRRAKRLAELGVNTLICGAISASLEASLVSADVGVIPHACGPVDVVLRAFLAGRLADNAFLMPGCCERRRRIRGRHHGERSKSKVQENDASGESPIGSSQKDKNGR